MIKKHQTKEESKNDSDDDDDDDDESDSDNDDESDSDDEGALKKRLEALEQSRKRKAEEAARAAEEWAKVLYLHHQKQVVYYN
jgi:hypothetical protein